MTDRDVVERLLYVRVEKRDQRCISDAIAEIKRLRERLEMDFAWQIKDGQKVKIAVEPGSIPDGIECRDETIRLQDAHIKELIERLRSSPDRGAIVEECARKAHMAGAHFLQKRDAYVMAGPAGMVAAIVAAIRSLSSPPGRKPE